MRLEAVSRSHLDNYSANGLLVSSDYQQLGRSLEAVISKLILELHKWLIIVPVVVLNTIVICSLCIIFSVLGFSRFANLVLATAWARLNLLVSLVKVEIAGTENIDPAQSYIMVANHQSLYDICVVYSYGKIDVKWVMKQELRSIPIFGLACEKLGHIIIDRTNPEAALKSLNEARNKLQPGSSIVFFAEGTRSRDGNLLPFKRGAFRLAIDLQLPILPVSIHGTRLVLPSDSTDFHPGNVKMKFHEPIQTHGLTVSDMRQLSDQTRDLLASALSE